MKRRGWFGVGAVLATTMAMGGSTCHGQPRATGREDTPVGPESPREQVMRSFDREAPKLGTRLPDVAAFHADGTELKPADLRGKYTVLVFGCLT